MTSKVSDAMIEAGIQAAWDVGLIVIDSEDAAAIYLAMKAKEEASAQSPADEVGLTSDRELELLRNIEALVVERHNLRAQLAAIRNGDEGMRGLQTFANTVHETTYGRCPWCGSCDHWAGQVGLCCAPSSRAIAAALDTTNQHPVAEVEGEEKP